MGGCRCVFRYCENTTSTRPGMHFFHFPKNTKERLQKWIQMSNNPNFVNLAPSALHNKVVCQEHFRDHCFMNILHDKLTKSAVPTILRLDTGEILDFEVDESELSQTRAATQDESMESSSFLLNSMIPMNEREFVPRLTVEPVSNKEPLDPPISQLAGPKLLNTGAQIDSSPKLHLVKPLKRLVRKKTSTLVPRRTNNMQNDLGLEIMSIQDNNTNSSCEEDIESIVFDIPQMVPREIETLEVTETTEPDVSLDQQIVMQHAYEMDELREDHDINIQQFEQLSAQNHSERVALKKQLANQTSKMRKMQAATNMHLRQIATQQKSISQLKTQNKTANANVELLKSQKLELSKSSKEYQFEIEALRREATAKDTQIEGLTSQISSQESTINAKLSEIIFLTETIEKQNEKIKKMNIYLKKQQSDIATLQQQQHNLTISNASLLGSVSTTSSSASIANNAKVKTEKNTPMPKPHLFNGIKRYLNPSMVALLRMEMFGEAEREYKPDERDLAMELMRLPAPGAQPGSVYDFMRSEWRFRLPPRNDVLQWIKEREENAQNVDSDWDDC